MAWHYLWTNTDSMPWADKYENAEEIWDLLINTYGWTEEASAAVIANFQSEGALNPAQWQIGSTIGEWDNTSTGLGLGQWTPPSKLGDYCGGNTQEDISDGDKQVEFTVTEPSQWVQRINSAGNSKYYGYQGLLYITSIDEFSQSTESPEDLATCWCACWEGCSKKAFQDTYTTRRENARYWYDEFAGGQTGYTITIKIVGNGTVTKSKSRADAGEYVDIEAFPNGTDTFVEWSVDSGGITLNPTDNPQTFEMPNEPVIITAEFTGETPQPPLPTPYYRPKHMPIWMYPVFRA